MKKQVLVMVVACALGTLVTPASAQFGGLKGGLTGGGASAASTDPQEFITSAKTAEKLMNNSLALLAGALSSKEKAAEFEAQRAAAKAITDPAEREAKLTEVRKSEVAVVNEKVSSANAEDQIKKMGAKQREELGAASYNFMLALLKDKALIDQGQGVVSSLSSNPMNLSKVGSVKDAISSLTGQASVASSIAAKMPAIFTAVGTKAPQSKDEKPKQTAQVEGE